MKLEFRQKQSKVRTYIIYFLTAIVLSLVQLILVPLIDVNGISPDLLILLVVIIVLNEGKFWGLFAGFAVGLLFDVISLDVIGTNALAKTVVAFITGWFYSEGKSDIIIGNIKFIFIVLMVAFVNNVIYNFLYVSATDLSFINFFLKYGIASAFYSTVFAVFPMLFKIKR